MKQKLILLFVRIECMKIVFFLFGVDIFLLLVLGERGGVYQCLWPASPSSLPLDVVTSSQYLWTLVKRHLLFAGWGVGGFYLETNSWDIFSTNVGPQTTRNFLCFFPIVRQFSFIFIVLEMSMFVWTRRTKYANCQPKQNLLPNFAFYMETPGNKHQTGNHSTDNIKTCWCQNSQQIYLS